MWALGGTYAEPLMSDEQPASWSFYETDLHTDRLAGNKQRQIAKSYRDAYCPNDALPGFAFHQTDRDPTALQEKACPDGRCSNHSRVRDFDLLGYRYSLLSSIGSGGLNNILNMLPARDPYEFNLFPLEDLAFVRAWINWADQHVSLLQLTRPVPSLATPGSGLADGTIMLREDNTGAMFLFNPTAREIDVSLPLSGEGNASLGFVCAATTPPILVQQLTTSERTMAAAINLQVLNCTGVLELTLPANSARMLGFAKLDAKPDSPLVLGAPYSNASIGSDGVVAVDGMFGESGTSATLVIMLHQDAPVVSQVAVNGLKTSFSRTVTFGLPAVVVRGSWAGVRFRRAQEVTPHSQSGGVWTGTFVVPPGVIAQLKARNASYPVVYDTDPEGSNDANVPWLAPGRLLIFIKYPQPIDDGLDVVGEVDGHPLLVRKAYNTIVRNPGRFIGYWADVTAHVQAGKLQKLMLRIPGQSATAAPSGVFFDNVETVVTDQFEPARIT